MRPALIGLDLIGPDIQNMRGHIGLRWQELMQAQRHLLGGGGHCPKGAKGNGRTKAQRGLRLSVMSGPPGSYFHLRRLVRRR